MSQNIAGLLVLRFGLATVYLWFGFSQIFDSLSWVGIVPEWAVNIIHLPPAMIVLGNGALEIALGGMLALGIWTRPVAVILALHLLPIIVSLGYSPISVRDFGLIIATSALALMSAKENFVLEKEPSTFIGKPIALSKTRDRVLQ